MMSRVCHKQAVVCSVPLGTWATLLLTGCGAPALRIHLVPANYDRISQSRPLVESFDLNNGFWWLNEYKELCFAFSDNIPPPGSEPKKTAPSFYLSLVTGEPPAGVGRNHEADRRTLRATILKSGVSLRLASYEGIVAVRLGEADPSILVGEFRVRCNEQDYTWWRGWTGNRSTILAGTFRATRNDELGPRINQSTEQGQMKRGMPIGKPIPITGPPLKDAKDK